LDFQILQGTGSVATHQGEVEFSITDL